MRSTYLIAAVMVAMAFTACSDAPKGDKVKIAGEQQAANANGETFVVDTTDSRIKFTGHGVGKNHPGIFKLASGNVAVADNQITGGEFVINIRSMEMEEKGEMFQNNLRGHLLSGDFFNADSFNTAKFVITNVQPYTANGNDTSIVDGANVLVSGNLTLKDETKNVTFPARLNLDQNTLKGKANFDIDRRQWKMNYGNDKTLGDKFISETVNVELDLQAQKPASN